MFNLEHLDLSEAGELDIQNNGFELILQLKTLNVSACNLDYLEAKDFSLTNKLITLDASWNSLKNLSDDLQKRMQFLEVANFSHNNIQNIDSDTLMPRLKMFHLDHNELSSIQLRNYKNLEILTLSDNQFKRVRRGFIKS